MEPIVITGASGFLGSSFLVPLLRREDVGEIYLLSRRPLDPGDRYLSKLFQSAEEGAKLWKKVTTIEADLSKPEDLHRALSKLASASQSRQFRFFHMAAQISENVDPGFIRRLNVGATRIIVEWANQHASRLVFISSVAAFGSTRSSALRSEDDFPFFENLNRRSLYFQTKREAHEAVLSLARVPADIFCPSIIHGPWDTLKDTRSRLTPFLKKGFRWVPPGGANFVALGEVLARLNGSLQSPSTAPSRTELVVGANWTFKQYIENYLKFYGIDRQLTVLPGWIFRSLESLSTVLPVRMGSLLHGARFLFFKSRHSRSSDAEIEAKTLAALQESVKFLKIKEASEEPR